MDHLNVDNSDTYTIALGLGANLGNREHTLFSAVCRLTDLLGRPLAVSSLYETKAWGFESDQLFLNQCIVFKAVISELELLYQLQKIESEFGRKNKTIENNYSSRTLDIDILLIDQQIINLPQLSVPHPLLHIRDFVLIPLVEIVPEWVHPVLGLKLETLAKQLESSEATLVQKLSL